MQHYNEELIALLLEHGAQATSAFDKVCPQTATTESIHV
jgi:hypothetical protein